MKPIEMGYPRLLVGGRCELGVDGEGGAFAVGYGIYYFAASVGAVAAGEEFGVAGLAGLAVDDDAASFEVEG